MTDAAARRRRGRPPKGDALSRDALLEAALPIFAAEGYETASLRQIAAAAGVDVALIGHRFGSKMELWQAVIDRLAGTLLASMSELAAGEALGLGIADRLRRALGHVVDVFCDQPAFAMLVVHQAPRDDVQLTYAFERLSRPYEQQLRPLVEQAIADGVLPASDPAFFIFGFFSAAAMLIAMRPMLSRSSCAAIDDAEFRAELKRSLLASLGLGRPD